MSEEDDSIATARRAADVARVILDGFERHYAAFRELSARARRHFEQGDWNAARKDGRARVDGRDAEVRRTVQAICDAFPDLTSSDDAWRAIKRAYLLLLSEHRQPECAETFYNSVACRLLCRRCYRNHYIFFRPGISTDQLSGDEPVYRCDHPKRGELRATVAAILSTLPLDNRFVDLERDVDRIMRAVSERFGVASLQENFQIHTLSSLFFRNRAAYLVGRCLNGDVVQPFVVALLQNRRHEVYVDTILFDAKNIGRVFSLVRAQFMVDMEVPAAHVEFLRTVLPARSSADLYTMLGLHKHAKTLFYRDLMRHVQSSSDRFVLMPGTRGMVMLVFTLPSFPFVFKVVRDWFDPPKSNDREHVLSNYRLMKTHDRVGRTADSLEYSSVALPRDRFDRAVLEEFARVAPSMVELEDDTLVLRHVYIERRTTPLDRYLRNASPREMQEAIDELGQTLKDLANVDIFPGDLIDKNFGVTHYGRVVLYDYDEVTSLLDVNFRSLPVARSDDEEFAAEPWFYVGPNDVFPAEVPTFMLASSEAREELRRRHPDLVTPRFWVNAQERVRTGKEPDVFPYSRALRFNARYVRHTAPAVEAAPAGTRAHAAAGPG
ncbi:MAG TPA: bifunctional isocitrate dehydrogenase kinase/phosphatase [Polyangiaceae bacterium]|nr:bifunctional isocitrate dehydrogenase kinase/phosphatase [Polyangiaceae bacterium]